MFCYVIMAHKDPDQILGLVRRIRALSPDADVIVRHAVRGLLDPADAERAGARVYRSDISVVWGDWSLTEAAVEILRHAHRTSPATHFVLISAQDYPIRDLAAWEQQVIAAGADGLIDVFDPDPVDHRYRWFTIDPPHVGPVPVRTLAKRVIGRTAPWYKSLGLLYRAVGVHHATPWFLGVRRLRPVRVEVTRGALWMTLSEKAVDAILDSERNQTATRRVFRRVRIPDESYLQSLVTTNPDLRWIDCPTSHSRWRYDEGSPADVTERELDYAAAGPAAFARKLVERAPAVLAKADAMTRRPVADVVPVAPVPYSSKLTGADLFPDARANRLATVPVWSPPAAQADPAPLTGRQASLAR